MIILGRSRGIDVESPSPMLGLNLEKDLEL